MNEDLGPRAAATGRIWARYWIETPWPLAKAAEVLAGEQSAGTFVPVPGHTPELQASAGARVEAIEEQDDAPGPSLPGARPPPGAAPRWRRAEILVSWPLATMGASLPNLQATVAGNLFELSQFSGLRLLALGLPPAFLAGCPGPAFGIPGTRRLAGVPRLPLVGTIIKPSVGLSPAATAALVDQLCAAGIDFIKDDELQADGPHCPFDARVAAVMAVVRRHADRTGRKAMVAFNLTGEPDEMRRRHDTVLAAGGSCVMASMHAVGLAGLLGLRRHAQLPIHAHRNGWGLFSRSPAVGVSYVAWQALFRAAGADHLHVNGLRNKFSEADASVLASARACLAPLSADAVGQAAMPVFSSGQWAGMAADTYAGLGSADLIHAAGGGIMAHPGGVAAGVRSLRLAWEAALAGEPYAQAAARHPELAAAATTFGEG
jgi:ribulose-bisphosphate carboxylase large chain